MGRPATRARHGSYLFQRGSVWWIKLQSPGKRIEKTLGTRDKVEAEIAASPLIAQHKAALLAARPRVETFWQHRLAPGREHAGPDGVGKILATDKDLFYIGPDGAIIRTEPNGGPAQRISSVPRLGLFAPIPPGMVPPTGEPDRPKLATKNSDDMIFENYLEHGGLKRSGVHGYSRMEAESVWQTFKKLSAGKPLKSCAREDGRALVKHFQDTVIKSATVHKKIVWLCAAVNLAIKEGQLTFNPFASVTPSLDDKLKRVPLDADDLMAILGGFDHLDKKDQLLFRLLATTGMRLSEATSIKSEEAPEGGVRFVICGTKTEASMRRVPLPADVLPFLPAKISGPLFKSEGASKRLNKFLRDCGIVDPAKCVHSLRHRAKDRLRSASCPLNLQYELLGHESRTVASGYGVGSPVPLLKDWIDKIGFAS